VKAENYKLYRPRFHKTNDQAIASYAAVLWWTKYAKYYLSEDQKIEMAEHGHLSSPFTIPLNKIDEVPTLPDVEVPLAPNDVRHALEFLQDAGLVKFKKQSRAFEVVLKEDRYIRLPQSVPVPRSGLDIAAKIIGKWASNRIKKPSKKPKHSGKRTRRQGGRRDKDTAWLFPQE
jgi:hypothetical protein